ncbi:MrcB family domain-containing protein [Klebsiella pneumoniae]|uniref:MrcB family domain-containing protein n=1 Tax=Klebsiella aerogenes TaxID=548 RepID=UPI00091F1EC7|nr:DUF3578 domain-containing protein [Klebsiella aerogenes]SFX79970.1 5-methylcytosine-specific restriction enzyme B [[Enterobacter] aerogenes] [Klebsiella aerogenes]
MITELIKNFLNQADEKLSQSTSSYSKEYRNLKISLSFGKGSYATVPWIAFLSSEQTPSNGIYPVILYYKDYHELILAYGVSNITKPELSWKGLPQKTITINDYFKKKHNKPAEKYGNSLLHSVYHTNTDIDYNSLILGLDEAIDKYVALLKIDTEAKSVNSNIKEIAQYNFDNAIEDLFISSDEITKIIKRLNHKKNIILQGPPGVGKSFIAKRLAYLLIGNKHNNRVGMIQFHQSYSYEDFIQGFRPNATGFTRKNGIFYEFCQKAKYDSKNNYVFIIDEINRANLSKVLGELMMLIEADKRGPDWAIPLTYSEHAEDTFFVPDNVFIIGLMNTADRSLAVVDYALRRRFSFINIAPGFDTDQYRSFMLSKGASEEIIDLIRTNMHKLNLEISQDKNNLGKGFTIGHSFFCPANNNEIELDYEWYKEVIISDIGPLLEEYWFDDPEKYEEWLSTLMENLHE